MIDRSDPLVQLSGVDEHVLMSSAVVLMVMVMVMMMLL
jgi:hypothetical protein